MLLRVHATQISVDHVNMMNECLLPSGAGVILGQVFTKHIGVTYTRFGFGPSSSQRVTRW